MRCRVQDGEQQGARRQARATEEAVLQALRQLLREHARLWVSAGVRVVVVEIHEAVDGTGQEGAQRVLLALEKDGDGAHGPQHTDHVRDQ